MRIAVVGSSGQLAGALVAAARAEGVALVTAGRPTVDLATGDGMERFLDDARPWLVVNAAAYTAVDRAEAEPDAAYRLNAEGPRKLARLCAARGVPMVHVSTDYVFDGRKTTPYVETDPTAPLGVYGATKLAGEDAIRSELPRHLILRTQWVYAASGANFVKTMLRLGAERDVVRVVADQFGSPTSAADLASSILAIAPRLASARTEAPWGTYHVSGAGSVTWHGFAAEIFRLGVASGLPAPRLEAITTADYPTPARRPAYSVLDNSKFKSTFGIALPRWQASLALTVAQLAGGLRTTHHERATQ